MKCLFETLKHTPPHQKISQLVYVNESWKFVKHNSSPDGLVVRLHKLNHNETKSILELIKENDKSKLFIEIGYWDEPHILETNFFVLIQV